MFAQAIIPQIKMSPCVAYAADNNAESLIHAVHMLALTFNPFVDAGRCRAAAARLLIFPKEMENDAPAPIIFCMAEIRLGRNVLLYTS